MRPKPFNSMEPALILEYVHERNKRSIDSYNYLKQASILELYKTLLCNWSLHIETIIEPEL